MLQENYQHVVVGQNYVSLIKGITYLFRGESCLLLDYKGFASTTNWLKNMSELDRKTLEHIGKTYRIDALQNISDYIKKDNTLIYFNDKGLEFCHSPYLNLKEIMRKFPYDFSGFFNDFFKEVEEESFNLEFDQFLGEFALLLTMSERENYLKHHEYKLVKSVLRGLLDFLEQASDFSKQINHIFQVMLQTCFTPEIDELEVQYLFIAALSPQYLLADEKLVPELLFIFRRLGGDVKHTTISNWGIVDNKVKYVTLDSIDGVIKLQGMDCFIPESESLPFASRLVGDNYLSIHFCCQLDHKYIRFFQDKRVLISTRERVGSDFPYWEFRFFGNEIRGIYAYLDSQGSKPSFYFHQIVTDVYELLKEIIPGLIKADWVSKVRLYRGHDSWFAPARPNEFYQVDKRKILYHPESITPLRGIAQQNTHFSGRMGLYAYLLDNA